MQPDFDKSAAAMIAGTDKAIAAAVAPLLKRIEALETRPMPERGEKGDRGEQGLVGCDGVGVRDGFLQREGVLILSLSDGTTRDLGVVVGKDGSDGKDGIVGETGPQGERGEQGPQGEKGERGEIGPIGEKGVDARDGRDGIDGKDGRDGFNLEDFDIVPNEDGRTIEMKFQRGDIVHSYELVFPVPVYRGIYAAGEAYKHGDVVTWGGSSHIAERDTDAKPETADSGWKCMVKRGRDGKDRKAV